MTVNESVLFLLPGFASADRPQVFFLRMCRLCVIPAEQRPALHRDLAQRSTALKEKNQLGSLQRFWRSLSTQNQSIGIRMYDHTVSFGAA